MSDIEFLSAEQVCDIQKATLPMAPSSNIGLVEGAVSRIINEYLYHGTSDIFELAALYLIAIAKAHAFPDANKRTAYQAALMFLDLNGIFISESDNLIEITVKAAEGTTNIQEIAKVLKHQRSAAE
ncbi:type II toxin-antitoxin system death-on-curing family toxin [Legionella feeleii]|uniref:Prophage maintenance system killer protein n=1 Tax=Legionella feeleii TaxID=453 RepID=A0A378KJF0_9GAMM|nr:type II toxin-antitoxin system death-on-curing family toxin [Legionella feeleii]STX88347.1 prophage maintenance system killer protein [Legionella feeleii]